MSVEIITEGGKEFVKMPKEEFERWEATVKLAKNKELQEKIKKSRKDYDEGKSKEWREVRDEV